MTQALIYLSWLCAVLGVEITPNFNRKKSILVCRKFKKKILNFMKEMWFF